MTTSWVRLWAVASLTLKEALRRRIIFFVLLLFAVALQISAAFFPSLNMIGRLRVMESHSLSITGLFTAIAVLFLAAFSLPGDFEQKRVYYLASKPLSKPTLFLGRLLGFSILVTLFIASMGLITVGYIRIVKLLSGDAFPALVAYPRLTASEFEAVKGQPIPANPDKLFALGGGEATLIWHFNGLRAADFPDRISVLAKIQIASPTDGYRSSGAVRFRVLNHELKRQSEKILPQLNTNEEAEFDISRDILGTGGDLSIGVSCLDSDGLVAGVRNSVVIYHRSANFELNFARGLTLALLQSLLVTALTLMASTVLSAPISVLLGITLYIMGNLHGYVLEGARDIDQTLDQIKAAQGTEKGEQMHTPEDLPPWVLRLSTLSSRAVLKIVPDFKRFDFSLWLLKDRAVSWEELGEAAAGVAPHFLVLTLLGVLIMSFKDFG